ncbi:IS3 family transposase [Dactylosporangium sp. CA-139066]|uniref:IS3 family transposase n=1 Tax=Dactylosporangium sp. CA-139066 TaxID=3239930 RepID=UPI003D91391D
MGRPSKYTEEFRRDAVELVRSSGRPINEVARELGMSHETLRNWVRRQDQPARPEGAAAGVGLSVADKDAEIARLRAEVAELRVEKEILRKAAAYFQGDGSVTSRFQFISTHRAVYGVKRLCRLLAVSRSGFYRWIAAEPDRRARAEAEDELADQIAAVHTESSGTYGSPRVTAELHAQGVRVNRKRVERVMRQRGIAGKHLRRRRRTTIPDPAAAPVTDLLRRDFTATAPDQRWCGDITYLRVGAGWLFLATVIDIATRRLIGWSINTHMRTSLVIDALEAAVAARGGQVDGVIFHTDKGSQYGSTAFAAVCDRHGVRRSTGRTGTSYDNALAEAFFATLKRELDVDRRTWACEADARRDVFRWIAFYNHRRRHSALGYHSPADYERTLTSATLQQIAA